MDHKELNGQSYLGVTGFNLKVGNRFTIYFDPANKMLPKRLVVSEGDETLTDVEIEMTNDVELGPILVRENIRSFKESIEEYREHWEFTNYLSGVSVNNDRLSCRIAKNTLVDESRFSQPFTYIMADRPPSESELLQMSLSPSGIQKYYTDARFGASLSQKITGRKVVILVALVASSLFFLSIVLTSLKRKHE